MTTEAWLSEIFMLITNSDNEPENIMALLMKCAEIAVELGYKLEISD